MHVAVFTKYLYRGGRPWLTDEFISALADAGHTVDVFHYQFDEYNARFNDSKIRVYTKRYHRGAIRTAVAHLRMLASFGRRLFGGKYDAVFSFSAFGFFAPLPQIYVRLLNRNARSIGILWDFYPVQRQEMGISTNRIVNKIIYLIESSELRAMETIGVMTDDNADYLRKYHPKVSADARTIGLWRNTSNDTPRTRTLESFSLTRGLDYAVFGGAVNEGRNLNLLLDAADLLAENMPNLRLLIVGAEDTSTLDHEIDTRRLDNVQTIDRLSVPDYLALLQYCSTGIVVTSPQVESPSFPSKTLDYMWAELPIVAAVAPQSDFGSLIAEQVGCGYTCPPNDTAAFVEAVIDCTEDHRSSNSLGKAGRAYLETNLSPAAAVKTLCRR